MSDKKTICKANGLIVNAAYKLDLIEQRLILLAIIQSRKSGRNIKPGEFITISVQDYLTTFPQDGHNVYGELKEATNTLYEKSFYFIGTSPNTGIERTESHRWLESKALYKDKHALIEFSFTAIVLKHIKELESHFTQYAIEKIADMSSAYAIRLYELLISYHNKGKREVEMEVAYLQELMQLNGKYKLLKDFKARVIDTAVAQVNDHSDLTIETPYGQRKAGRSITHFVFKFDLKPELKTAKETAKVKPAVKATVKPATKPAPYAPPTSTMLSKEEREKAQAAKDKALAEIAALRNRPAAHNAGSTFVHVVANDKADDAETGTARERVRIPTPHEERERQRQQAVNTAIADAMDQLR